MRLFFSENFGKFVYLFGPVGSGGELPKESAGDIPGKSPEKAPEKPELGANLDERANFKNVLLEQKGEITYNHKNDLQKNVKDLLWSGLREKMRDWILDETWPILVSHTAELKELLPKPDEEPDEEEHVMQLRLEGGQIIFVNGEGKEIHRVDISFAFRDAEFFQRRYQTSRETASRVAMRERRQAGSDAYRRMVLEAALGIGMPPAKAPKAPPIPPEDPDEVEAITYTMDSLEKREKRRTDILYNFEAAVQSHEEDLDDIEKDWKKGYQYEITLDGGIAEFDDDDWSAETFLTRAEKDQPRPEGKWKDVVGHRNIEEILKRDPEHYATVAYREFLKSKEKDLEKIKPEIRVKITKNFKRDKAWFDERRKEIERASSDSRIQTDLGYVWNMRADILAVSDLLNGYDASHTHTVYRINPFKEFGWNVDNVRQVVQGASFLNRNDRVSFDDVADELYAKKENFELLKQRLKDLKIPDEILEELNGKNLKGDYGRMKKLLETYKGDSKKREQIGLVKDFLGDYVTHIVELLNALSKASYEPSKPFETDAAYRREGNIYFLNRDAYGDLLPTEKGSMATAKILLADIFLGEDPKRYHTVGEKIGGWFSGEDTTDRVITMRDMNGKYYSVDSTWFKRGISGETAFKQAFERCVQIDGSGREIMNPVKLQNQLTQYLQLGLSIYSKKPTERLQDILDRNHVFEGERYTQKPTYGENIQALFAHFQKELFAFVDALNAFQNDHASMNGDNLEEFFKSHKLSEDLKNFIQMGSHIDYETSNERVDRAELLRYQYKMKPEEAARIVADLEKLGTFSKPELDQIRDRLIAGVFLGVNGEGVSAAGLGLALPLPHGYYLKFAMGVHDWNKFLVGGGAGKSFQVSEKLTISLEAGVGVNIPSGAVGAGAGVIAIYQFEKVNLYAGGGISTLGPYALVGYENRPEVQARERIDRKLLEAHISGKDGLASYSENGRYVKVLQNPDEYPEFSETLHAMEALGIAPESRPVVFNEFYNLYLEMLNAEGIKEQPDIPIIRCTYRGIGLGGSVTNPIGFVIPLRFSIPGLADHLVFRLADADTEEDISSAVSKEKLLKGKQTKISERTIALKGHLIVDENGRLAMAREKIEALDIDLNRPWKKFRTTFEKNLDAQIGTPDEKGLIPILFNRAYGDIVLAVDPDLGENVFAVGDGDNLSLSVDKSQKVYIAREDITYPFQNEGGVETTYITVSKNPHIPRRGPGGVHERSPFFLTKQRGKQWRREKNLEFSGDMSQVSIRTMAEYNSWLEDGDHPERINTRLNKLGERKHKEAAGRIAKALGISLEKLELPEGFEKALEEMKSDPLFMDSFKRYSTQGFVFEHGEKKVSPLTEDGMRKWKEHLPDMKLLINTVFNNKKVPSLNALAMDQALTELTVESFVDMWHKDNPDEAYKLKLESFDRPMLASIFKDYVERTYPSLDSSAQEKKADAMVSYVMAQFVEIHPTTAAVEPIPEGYHVASLVGSKGGEDPVTGIRRLYNYSKSSENVGMLYPAHLQYNLSKNTPEGDVARFWLGNMSELDLPDLETITNFGALKGILRKPLPMLLAHYAKTFLNPDEHVALASAIEATNSANPIAKDSEKAAMKKFLTLCKKVREAQLAGKTELPIEGTDFTFLLNTDIRLGAFRRCTNVTAVVRETVRLKENSSQKLFAVSGDRVITVKTGFRESTFGISAAPGFTVAVGGAGEEKVPPQKAGGRRVLPR